MKNGLFEILSLTLRVRSESSKGRGSPFDDSSKMDFSVCWINLVIYFSGQVDSNRHVRYDMRRTDTLILSRRRDRPEEAQQPTLVAMSEKVLTCKAFALNDKRLKVNIQPFSSMD